MTKEVPSVEEIMRRVQRTLMDVNSEPYILKLYSASNPSEVVISLACSLIEYFLASILT